ncbi:MAG TPA: hypothetical protein QGI67_06075, partial [Acidimicrobiales bacterium]|nr:hypothetical protein [Acidimicrobiales bacterium]
MLTLVAGGCGGDGESEAAEEPVEAVTTTASAGEGGTVLKIAVAAPEKGNDFGWNQQGVDGAIAAAAAFGVEIEVADAL